MILYMYIQGKRFKHNNIKIFIYFHNWINDRDEKSLKSWQWCNSGGVGVGCGGRGGGGVTRCQSVDL